MQNFGVACLEEAEKFVAVGWWSRPVLGFSFSQAEQKYGQYSQFFPVGHLAPSMIKDSETPAWLGLSRNWNN